MATQFFPIPPQGLGTEDVEALDSYILRLATEHGVTEYQFHRLLASWWNQVKGTGQIALGRHVGYVSKIGYGKDIDTLVKALEKGTGQIGLSSLTLGAFRDICGTHVGCQSRHVHHWCPACLRDQIVEGLPVYEKLAWRINSISRCRSHRLFLESACPWCGKHQLRHVNTWPDCSECGGSIIAEEHFWRPALYPTDGESDMLEVIAYCAKYPGTVFHRNAARELWRLIREDQNKRCHTGSEYFHRRPEPKRTLIPVLLRFARELNVPLLSILLDPVEASAIRALPIGDSAPPSQARSGGSRKRLTAPERKVLGRKLKGYVKKGKKHKSLKQLCTPFTTSQARYWYPEVVRAVLERGRSLKRDVSKDQKASLKRINIDLPLVLKAGEVGWHKVEADLSAQLDIPIHRLRRHFSDLKKSQKTGDHITSVCLNRESEHD